MAYERDVRRAASTLGNSARNAQSERRKISTLVDGSNQWWKGKGGEAFIKEYKVIDNDAAKFLRYMDRAIDGLNRLPSLIARAERERREEAARKAEADK